MEVYCLAHGVDVKEFDVETYRELYLMYADGMIGNRKILEMQGLQTSAMFNYMRGKGQAPFRMKDILTTAWDYFEPPLSKEELEKKKQMQMAAFVAQFGGLQ